MKKDYMYKVVGKKQTHSFEQLFVNHDDAFKKYYSLFPLGYEDISLWKLEAYETIEDYFKSEETKSRITLHD